jgi:hypothetical protein
LGQSEAKHSKGEWVSDSRFVAHSTVL